MHRPDVGHVLAHCDMFTANASNHIVINVELVSMDLLIHNWAMVSCAKCSSLLWVHFAVRNVGHKLLKLQNYITGFPICNIGSLHMITISFKHYNDVIMSTTASQITSLTIVYSTIYLFRHRPKKTSKLCITGLVREIHQLPVNSPHKRSVTGKMFPFDDIVMK